jgi:molybdate transport system substrate-binding protein
MAVAAKWPWRGLLFAFGIAIGISSSPSAQASTSTATIAIAANFVDAAKEIAAVFESETDHVVRMSFGSTGQLYAQISQGAPFDAFLAADRERPLKAVRQGFATENSQFTYATGRLVLFSANSALVTDGSTLHTLEVNNIAIANPVTAPYGSAAVETMRTLGVFDSLRDRIVQGNNIAQAYQFVFTGNADVGFVALAQVLGKTDGSRWIVPETLHSPIAQDAVLLKQGTGNDAAQAFLTFMRTSKAQRIIAKFGYGSGQQDANG